MSQDPKYVITSPMGGTVNLDAICDRVSAQNPEDEVEDAKIGEDYWPKVPDHFRPPPAHLENAIKEVNYIVQLIRTSPSPTIQSSNLECYSDLLLSLETRADLTQLVLTLAEADYALTRIIKSLSKQEKDSFNLVQRATALRKHWGDEKRSMPKNQKDDFMVAPFLTTLPAHKPHNWRLEFTEQATEEAQKLYDAMRSELDYGYSYFSVHPPRPMGWVPVNDRAWSHTDRAKIQSGDLYHSKDWSPIYMSFGLQSIDYSLKGWEHPAWSETQKQEHEALEDYERQWTDSRKEMELRREDVIKA